MIGAWITEKALMPSVGFGHFAGFPSNLVGRWLAPLPRLIQLSDLVVDRETIFCWGLCFSEDFGTVLIICVTVSLAESHRK